MNSVGIINQYHSQVIEETSSLQRKGHSYFDIFPEIIREVKWPTDNYFNIILKKKIIYIYTYLG